jgi:hypothetical protein
MMAREVNLSNSALDPLKLDSTFDSFGALPTPAVVRRALMSLREVKLLAGAIRHGTVTEIQIRRFTSELVSCYQPNTAFPSGMALAALAVALEQSQSDFAEEYLLDLARLKLSELHLSIQVAKACLKARSLLNKNEKSEFKYPLTFLSRQRSESLSMRPSVREGSRNQTRTPTYSFSLSDT